MDFSGEGMMEFKNTNMLSSQMKLSMALSQRKIYLYDDIDENSIFETIYYFNKLVDVDKKLGTKLPIELYINSNGGSVYDCLSLVSLIEHMVDDGYEITTINMGRAFSAGFIVSIVGSKRATYRYSRYMFHDIMYGVFGKHQHIKETLEESEKLKTIINNIVLKHTDITLDMLNDIYNRMTDRYFEADEALQLKIADTIL